MAGKVLGAAGIEYDHSGIRCARVSCLRKGRERAVNIENLHESNGDFSKDDALVEGLRSAAEVVGARLSDRVAICVSGRQVHLSQQKFRELPESEMKKALRAEIRKNLTFDSAGSTIDYQVMDERDAETGSIPVVTVTAVPRSLMEQQMRLVERAGIHPTVMDVLPAAIANSFWERRTDADPGKAYVMIHFSPDLCTLVIDGMNAPFYSRSILFSAGEMLQNQPLTDEEKARRFDHLAEELRRSLTYYHSNFGSVEFGALYTLCRCAAREELRAFLCERLDLPDDDSTLLDRLHGRSSASPGTFDVALALALRGVENR